jgi:hypothetical protein
MSCVVAVFEGFEAFDIERRIRLLRVTDIVLPRNLLFPLSMSNGSLPP